MSTLGWPASAYWPKLAEDNGVKYRNYSLTYKAVSDYAAKLINQTQNDAVTEFAKRMDEIETYINKNFLKVE